MGEGGAEPEAAMNHGEPLVKMARGDGPGTELRVSRVVNTKAYRDAFERMPLPRVVADAAYRQAGRILERTNGTEYEHMAVVNARTGALVADSLSGPSFRRRTGLSPEGARMAAECEDGVVVIHNHPSSTPPSYQDVLTAAREPSIDSSVIIGHDGSVWRIAARAPGIVGAMRRLYNELKETYGDYAEIAVLKLLVERKWVDWRRMR